MNDKVVCMYVRMCVRMYVCITLPLDTCAGAIFLQNVLNAQARRCMRFQVMVDRNVLEKHGTIV